MMALSSAPSSSVPTSIPVPSTASGYIALLDEPDSALQTHALQKLLECVDVLWHQVAECLPKLEALAEADDDTDKSIRQIAAAVASRVLFYLEEPSSALRMALLAGPQYFDWKQAAVNTSSQRSPYVERLVAAALDAYRAARNKEMSESQKEETTAAADDDMGLSADQLLPMIHCLLEGSCAAGFQEHALGMALEGQEIDQVSAILKSAVATSSTMAQPKPTMAPLLKYALQACTTAAVSSKSFRNQTLQVIAECLHEQISQGVTEAAYDLVVTHQLLGQAAPVAEVLSKLLRGSEREYLLALQLAFDIMDSGNQAFVSMVAQDLTTALADDPSIQPRLEQMNRIIIGGFFSELALSFLHKHSKADKLIMETLKKTLEERSSGSRSSILHHAAILAHGYLYSGTTNDSFLRDNLEWMKKASNW
jgi:26S proteasome regulatory subunit N2